MTSRSACTKSQSFYYICPKRKYYGPDAANGCDGDLVSSHRLHDVVWDELGQMLTSEETVSRVYRAARAIGRQQTQDSGVEAMKAELAKTQRDLSLWYTRHDESGGDAEKEAAWKRIIQLTEKEKELTRKLQSNKGRRRPKRALRKKHVRE
jgi:hypothetical protein